MSVEIDGVNNIIKTDTISEVTSANGVAVDGVTLKDGGIAATDGSTITVTDNSDNLTLKSTDTDANGGPNLRLYRAVVGAAADTLGVIDFAGQDAGGNLADYARIEVAIDDATDGNEDAALIFRILNGGALNQTFKMTGPETVINDASIDHDFRVESNGNENMLFVNGGTDRIGVGTNTPDMLLDVTGAISAGAGTDEDLQQWNIGSDNVKAKITYLDASANRGYAIGTSTQHDFFLRTNNNIGLKVDINGAVTKPLQPCFRVGSGTQNDIAVSSNVNLVFDSEVFDIGANFASNTFTAPVTGKYAIQVHLRIDNVDTASSYIQLSLVGSNRNTTMDTFFPISNFISDDGEMNLRGSTLLDMDANDTAVARIRIEGGTAQADLNNDGSYFTGYLVA